MQMHSTNRETIVVSPGPTPRLQTVTRHSTHLTSRTKPVKPGSAATRTSRSQIDSRSAHSQSHQRPATKHSNPNEAGKQQSQPRTNSDKPISRFEARTRFPTTKATPNTERVEEDVKTPETKGTSEAISRLVTLSNEPVSRARSQETALKERTHSQLNVQSRIEQGVKPVSIPSTKVLATNENASHTKSSHPTQPIKRKAISEIASHTKSNHPRVAEPILPRKATWDIGSQAKSGYQPVAAKPAQPIQRQATRGASLIKSNHSPVVEEPAQLILQKKATTESADRKQASDNKIEGECGISPKVVVSSKEQISSETQSTFQSIDQPVYVQYDRQHIANLEATANSPPLPQYEILEQISAVQDIEHASHSICPTDPPSTAVNEDSSKTVISCPTNSISSAVNDNSSKFATFCPTDPSSTAVNEDSLDRATSCPSISASRYNTRPEEIDTKHPKTETAKIDLLTTEAPQKTVTAGQNDTRLRKILPKQRTEVARPIAKQQISPKATKARARPEIESRRTEVVRPVPAKHVSTRAAKVKAQPEIKSRRIELAKPQNPAGLDKLKTQTHIGSNLDRKRSEADPIATSSRTDKITPQSHPKRRKSETVQIATSRIEKITPQSHPNRRKLETVQVVTSRVGKITPQKLSIPKAIVRSPTPEQLDTDPIQKVLLWQAMLPNYRKATHASSRKARPIESDAASTVSFASTKSRTPKLSDSRFRESVFPRYGITINKVTDLRTSFEHFGTKQPDVNVVAWYQRNHKDSNVWLTPDPDRIAHQYDRLIAIKSNEAKLSHRGKLYFLKEDDVFGPGDSGRSSSTYFELEWAPNPNPEQLLFVPPALADGDDFNFNTNPDCTYWLTIRRMNPAYRAQISMLTFVLPNAKAAAPYLTIEFKKDTDSFAAALNQIAVSSTLILYNRFLLRLKRLQATKSVMKHVQDIKHYGIAFNGSEVYIYLIRPVLKDAEWNGCTITQICQYDVRDRDNVVSLSCWINEIHNWGLGQYSTQFELDIKVILSMADGGDRVSLTAEELKELVDV